jgi:hypothetical protein
MPDPKMAKTPVTLLGVLPRTVLAGPNSKPDTVADMAAIQCQSESAVTVATTLGFSWVSSTRDAARR